MLAVFERNWYRWTTIIHVTFCIFQILNLTNDRGVRHSTSPSGLTPSVRYLSNRRYGLFGPPSVLWCIFSFKLDSSRTCFSSLLCDMTYSAIHCQSSIWQPNHRDGLLRSSKKKQSYMNRRNPFSRTFKTSCWFHAESLLYRKTGLSCADISFHPMFAFLLSLSVKAPLPVPPPLLKTCNHVSALIWYY